MNNQNECLLEHLVENKNYKGLVDCGFCTQEEVERLQAKQEVDEIIKLQAESFNEINKELCPFQYKK